MPKILFIGPKFYNYHLTIKKGFEDAGFEVDYFDDRPSSNIITKILVRINKNLIKLKIREYFNKIKQKAKENKYDIVFVLYGQSFTKEMMKELKEKTPNSRFIFYMYDPFYSMPDREEFTEVFDDCYSFDFDDCKKNPNFKLVPLFYSFSNEIVDYKNEYDACAIITMMPGKYSKVSSIVNQMRENNFNVYNFYFVQSKAVWLYYKMKSKDFKNSKWNEFTTKRMPNACANELLQKSKYIIDCPKEGQSGLTIRTFEALAANKKIITTNKSIVNYDFYNPQNIYIYDGKIDFNNEFFKTEYLPIDSKIKENYSIDNWVKKILSKYYEEENK